MIVAAGISIGLYSIRLSHHFRILLISRQKLVPAQIEIFDFKAESLACDHMTYTFNQLHMAVLAIVQVAFAYCHFPPADTLAVNILEQMLGM